MATQKLTMERYLPRRLWEKIPSLPLGVYYDNWCLFKRLATRILSSVARATGIAKYVEHLSWVDIELWVLTTTLVNPKTCELLILTKKIFLTKIQI